MGRDRMEGDGIERVITGRKGMHELGWVEEKQCEGLDWGDGMGWTRMELVRKMIWGGMGCMYCHRVGWKRIGWDGMGGGEGMRRDEKG